MKLDTNNFNPYEGIASIKAITEVNIRDSINILFILL